MTDDLDSFVALPPASVPGGYSVGKALGPHHRVARSSDGFPAILVAATGTGRSNPRRLQHIRYSPPRSLTLLAPNGVTRTEQLAVVECIGTESALIRLFFQLTSAVLRVPACHDLTEDDLEGRLDELVELFRALTHPGTTTVQGLWAELATIVWSSEPRIALASWHSSPKARHDFSAGVFGLEVKSSARGLREHHARMNQLTAAEGGMLLLASFILTEDEEAGASVGDLVAMVAARVEQDPELVGRLHTIVARSLGRDAIEEPPLRFNLDAARRDLRIYNARELPAIPQPVPAEIREIEYVVDLSTTTPLSIDDARLRGDFFAALLASDA